MALLVGAKGGDPDVLHFGKAAERFESVEAGEGAVGLPEHAEVEEGTVEPFGRAEVGEGADGSLEVPESLLVAAS